MYRSDLVLNGYFLDIWRFWKDFQSLKDLNPSNSKGVAFKQSLNTCKDVRALSIQFHWDRHFIISIDVFEKFSHLRSLDISWANIEILEPDIFKSLCHLTVLSLTQN